MKLVELENKIQGMYRDYLKDACPQIKKDKKQFIRSHFSGKTSVWEYPAVFSAFAVTVLLLGFFVHLQGETEGVKKGVAWHPPEINYFRVLQNPAQPKRVQVKRVASRVGTTMVYQIGSEDIPLTVVWVFMPPSSQTLLTAGSSL